MSQPLPGGFNNNPGTYSSPSPIHPAPYDYASPVNNRVNPPAYKEEVDAPPSYSQAVLPPGWEAKVDPWQRVYYIDHNRGLTQWEPPRCDPPYEGPATNGITDGAAYMTPPPPILYNTMDPLRGPSTPAMDGGFSASAHTLPSAPMPSLMEPSSTTTGLPPFSSGAFPPPYTASSYPPHTSSLFTAQTSTYPPAPAPALSPNVAFAFDWSGAAADATVDLLADIPATTLDDGTSAQSLGLCSALVQTVARNSGLCWVSLALWAILAAVLTLGPLKIVGFGQLLLIAFIAWTVTITARVGCCWGCLPGCRPASSGMGVNDRPVQALGVPFVSSLSPFMDYLAGLREVHPTLTLNVECSRKFVTGSGGKSRTHMRVSFRAQRDVPLVRWRDATVSNEVLLPRLREWVGGNAWITSECVYRLLPAQAALLEALEKHYYDQHRHRDAHTRVWTSYSVARYSETRVDAVANHSSYAYILYCMLCNWLVLYVSVWSTLYVFYIALWRWLHTPVKVTNIKYLQIAPPHTHTAPETVLPLYS